MKRINIWSSDIDLSDWRDFLEEENLLNADEEVQYEAVYNCNYSYLEDERVNFGSIDIGNNEILAIADLGLWDGRRKGYKLFNSLSDVLYNDSSCDSVEWFIERNTLKAVMYHHDGTNYIEYYLITKEDTLAKENLLRDIYMNKEIHQSRIYRNCKSVGKLIKNFYGVA